MSFCVSLFASALPWEKAEMNGFPFRRLFISIASKLADEVVPFELALHSVHMAPLSDMLISEMPRRLISCLLSPALPAARLISASGCIQRRQSLLTSHKLSRKRSVSVLFLFPYQLVKKRPTLYFSCGSISEW